MNTKSKPYWLIHHGILLEYSTEPIAHRRYYIKTQKPEHERAIRLRWLRPVARPDLLPKSVIKAVADWHKTDVNWKKTDADRKKAYANWKKADADWNKSNEDRKKAYANWKKADANWLTAYTDWQKLDVGWKRVLNKNWKNIVKRHKAECPGCPFDYENKTLIF